MVARPLVETDSNDAHKAFGVIMVDAAGSAVGTSASPMATQEAPSSSGATTSIASVATVVTLKAANSARKSIVINNDSTSILYVLLGAGTVSASLYTYSLAAKGTVSANLVINGYTGVVTGIWSAANGSALVTELT